MLQKILFLTSFVLFIFLGSKPVSAHFLQTDGNIGAMLHVEPNDNPTAGEQASIFIELKDKQNKFTAENCDCTLSVLENDKEIFSQQLFQNPKDTNTFVSYTFPQKDIYEIKVTGKPLTYSTFQPFTLRWNFRVEQNADTQNPSGNTDQSFFSRYMVFILAIGIIAILFVIYFVNNSLQKNPTKEGGEKHEKKDNSNNH